MKTMTVAPPSTIIRCRLALCFVVWNIVLVVEAYHATPPKISRATQLPNQIYEWKGQKIRYQVAEPAKHPENDSSIRNVLLIHGLFVNSDHWRYTLKGLSEAGYRVYAMDMLGSGYSSKPPRDSPEAQALCGERQRFVVVEEQKDEKGEETFKVIMVDDDDNNTNNDDNTRTITISNRYPSSILENISLGTASGGTRIANVDLRHPLESPYNFFTWADQIADFCRDVIHDDDGNDNQTTTLICNSIGTISSLQAIKDYPNLFNGLFVINPNFRELHTAEVPFPRLSMPLVRVLQNYLVTKGQSLFDALATPSTVKQILKEPYKIQDAIDDELVDVLLTPLLTRGASDVVFDTLSYSAGPLPEQILGDLSSLSQTSPKVWVCYGTDDPWTPSARVESLKRFSVVEKVVPLEGVGHCPHDEAPHLVNPLLTQFLSHLEQPKKENESTSTRLTTTTTSTKINQSKPFFLV